MTMYKVADRKLKQSLWIYSE